MGTVEGCCILWALSVIGMLMIVAVALMCT